MGCCKIRSVVAFLWGQSSNRAWLFPATFRDVTVSLRFEEFAREPPSCFCSAPFMAGPTF